MKLPKSPKSLLSFVSAFFLIFLTLNTTAHAAGTVMFQEPPLIQAAQKGDYDKIRSLLLQGTDPNLTGTKNVTVMIIATQSQLADIVELTIEFGALINKFDVLGNNSLLYAVDNTDYEIVTILIDASIDVNHTNNQGETALHWAARVGDMEIIEMLMDAGADPKKMDYTGRGIIDYARNSRNSRLVENLAKIGIE